MEINVTNGPIRWVLGPSRSYERLNCTNDLEILLEATIKLRTLDRSIGFIRRNHCFGVVQVWRSGRFLIKNTKVIALSYILHIRKLWERIERMNGKWKVFEREEGRKLFTNMFAFTDLRSTDSLVTIVLCRKITDILFSINAT